MRAPLPGAWPWPSWLNSASQWTKRSVEQEQCRGQGHALIDLECHRGCSMADEELNIDERLKIIRVQRAAYRRPNQTEKGHILDTPQSRSPDGLGRPSFATSTVLVSANRASVPRDLHMCRGGACPAAAWQCRCYASHINNCHRVPLSEAYRLLPSSWSQRRPSCRPSLP